jgi:cyanophycinase
MTGYLLLAGGAEFGGQMALVDRQAMVLAGGFAAPMCIVPTAAAYDHNHERAGNNGLKWFQSLGARNVSVVPLIDSFSAGDAQLANQLRRARLIYLLGGSPRYLEEVLQNSLCWQALLQAYADGAVVAGSSAGAMVLCQYYFDPTHGLVRTGLNVLSNCCILPHHNTFGQTWFQRLTAELPEVTLIGIDERTGLLDNGKDERKSSWRVYGQGHVALYRHGKVTIYGNGEQFDDAFAR